MFQDTGSDVGGRYPQRKSGMRLITQRSQVQILPPLQVKVQVRGPFSLRGGRASDVLDCVRYAEPPGCRWRRPLGSRWVGPLSVCTTGAHTPRAYTCLLYTSPSPRD